MKKPAPAGFFMGCRTVQTEYPDRLACQHHIIAVNDGGLTRVPKQLLDPVTRHTLYSGNFVTAVIDQTSGYLAAPGIHTGTHSLISKHIVIVINMQCFYMQLSSLYC